MKSFIIGVLTLFGINVMAANFNHPEREYEATALTDNISNAIHNFLLKTYSANYIKRYGIFCDDKYVYNKGPLPYAGILEKERMSNIDGSIQELHDVQQEGTELKFREYSEDHANMKSLRYHQGFIETTYHVPAWLISSCDNGLKEVACKGRPIKISDFTTCALGDGNMTCRTKLE